MWFDLVDATDEILLANLRSRAQSRRGGRGVPRVLRRQVAEHDRTVRHMLLELDRRRKNHGGRILLSALRHIWVTLAALKVEVALMGGIAVAAWHHIRNTRDVDLLVDVNPADEQELLGQLSGAGFKPMRDPPLLQIGESRILQLSYEPPGRFLDIRIDLFLADSEFHRQALARRVTATLPGMSVPAPFSVAKT